MMDFGGKVKERVFPLASADFVVSSVERGEGYLPAMLRKARRAGGEVWLVWWSTHESASNHHEPRIFMRSPPVFFGDL